MPDSRKAPPSNLLAFAVFIDTSVYISALISSTGASHGILYAAEAGAFTVYVSPGLLLEAEKVLVNKFGSLEMLRIFEAVVASINPTFVETTKEEVIEACSYCSDISDAPFLASALKAGVKYFITLDKKSFKRKIFRSARRLNVITPSYFLKLLRRLAGERFPGVGHP